MKYRVIISSLAEAEIDSVFLQISNFTSPNQASQWYSGLLKAIYSLSEFPRRCSLSGENEYSSQEIRQLLYGRGRKAYRVLFTILEDQEIPTVRILNIRYASRQTIGEPPTKNDER